MRADLPGLPLLPPPLARVVESEEPPEPILSIPGLITAPMSLHPVQRRRLIEARQERVAAYMLRGMTEARIAEAIGYSASQAHYDIEEVRQRWRESTIDSVEQAAALDLARLEFAAQALYPGVARGDPKAIDSFVKVIQERGSILGYRQGLSIDFEAYIRGIAESNGYDPDKAVELAAKVTMTFR